MAVLDLLHGDCLHVLAAMPADSVDAIVTDPPYGLSFMGKRWDYDVPGVDIWSACLRVLKPGGHLLAFAGTRTQHRMAVKIEDAGFEIRDMIAWVYGSGFPKSLDVSKAIDKAAGATREVTGRYEFPDGGSREKPRTASERVGQLHGHKHTPITAPATPDARRWSGWGTALKPAMEPITVARKPLVGTVAENVLQHGTGAINVDGCRVEGKPRLTGTRNSTASAGSGNVYLGSDGAKQMAYDANPPAGRWPANLIHDGSDEVLAGFPSSTNVSKGVRGRGSDIYANGKGFANTLAEVGQEIGYGDSGSAARFFYCAKASKADRDEGCEGLEERPTVSAVGMGKVTAANWGDEDQKVYDRKTKARNHHPTVKPTELMRYLVRLVTPSGGTVLDPFMGSGSTGKAAVLEGFGFIGIERELEYIEIARARIAHALQSDKQQTLLL